MTLRLAYVNNENDQSTKLRVTFHASCTILHTVLLTQVLLLLLLLPSGGVTER